jgi:hypothetical protein
MGYPKAHEWMLPIAGPAPADLRATPAGSDEPILDFPRRSASWDSTVLRLQLRGLSRWRDLAGHQVLAWVFLCSADACSVHLPFASRNP